MLTTWTPDRRLAVGDVVTHASGGTVRVERKLAELAIEALPPVNATDGASSTLLQSGVTVEASADVRLPAGVARIALTGSRSFLFIGDRARLVGFATLDDLRRQMLAMSVLGRWQPEWSLVTAVRQYSAGTVVVAESDAVRAEIRVEGSAMVTSLAGIVAGCKISVTSGRAATYAMNRCTPFYEALRVRRRLSGSRVEPVARRIDDWGPADLDAGTVEVVRVTLDDVGLVV